MDKEVKTPPKELDNRRGKPPTWYKEQDVPQFERMISNPNGAVLREKETEYIKNLDEMTSEIPVIDMDLMTNGAIIKKLLKKKRKSKKSKS